MKTVTLLLILACLSTYGVAQEVPLYENITDNVPKIGATAEVYMGDRMLEQRTGEYRECIIPQRSLELMSVGFIVTIKAEEPICKEAADSELYKPTYLLFPSDTTELGRIKLEEKNDKYKLKVCPLSGFSLSPTCPRRLRFKEEIDKNQIEFNNRYFIYTKDSLQQTIEYAGKSGNILKFLYSEFNEGMARDAFNREFQVDLSEGNVLAFKGALIEIESATNINIKYKVIRNFRQ